MPSGNDPAAGQQIGAAESRVLFPDGKRPEVVPPRFIKAETNLLRWPIFSLATKALKNVDHIRCEGVKREGTRQHRFSLVVSRNTRYMYPGPLGRKVHMALQSLLVESGHPFKNPIVFTWRELARRMGISINGTKIARMKDAIRSIHGTIISTEYALKAGGEKREPLPFRESGYSLYQKFQFEGIGEPDNPMADLNAVWFDDWLLANLNSFYVAPLDYHLWQSLNDKSPIASRLYEFLLFNFAGKHASFTINYPNLAQFLPVRVERFVSLAQKQLAPAFELLQANLVVRSVEWLDGKTGTPKLRIIPGPLLASTDKARFVGGHDTDELLDDVRVTEVSTGLSPGASLARDFYLLWQGQDKESLSKSDRDYADELLDRYGRAEAIKMLPRVIKLMRERFPSAASFVASRHYFGLVEADLERRRKADERATAEEQRLLAEKQREGSEREAYAALEREWQLLPASEQSLIRERVLATHSASLKLEKIPTLLHRFCLRELGRRLEPPVEK